MSEPKFTPGPWEWHIYEPWQGKKLAYLRQSSKVTPPWGWTDIEFTKDDPIIDDGSGGGEYNPTIAVPGPNACLIAAAPELYKALEELISECSGQEGFYTLEARVKLAQALIHATAVLAKARGEQ